MQTVDKAMALLGHFSPVQPEIGLSELGRLAGFDKAATRRFLVALAKHSFIEQNQDNKKYRLGSAFLHFARLREATRPLSSIVQSDIMCTAKATTNGYYPFGAVMIHEKMVDVFETSKSPLASIGHGYTYSGHPVGAAAALACLAETRQLDVVQNAALTEAR